MHKNIGNLTGPVLVFGGIYSNLQALEQLKVEAGKLGIEPNNIICTGDIVGYCAQPEESLQFVQKWGIHTVAGNVEIQLRENQDDCGCDFNENSTCDILSKQWYPYAKNKVSQNSIQFIQSIPEQLSFTYAKKKITVIHGSAEGVSDFVFKSTPWSIKKRSFEILETDVILAGHCGLPFTDKNESKLWINPGVIGMPANDGDTRVWYFILNDSNGTVSVSPQQLTYNYLLASQLMEDEKLPRNYSKTLITGIWDNCDILPKKETEQQGQPIRIDLP